MAKKTYRVIVQRVKGRNGRGDWWVVHVPELPTADTVGSTLAEARSNVRGAIALILGMKLWDVDIEVENHDETDQQRDDRRAGSGCDGGSAASMGRGDEHDPAGR